MKNYIIKKGENKYSPFAGTKLISDMIDKLNIKDNLNTSFGLPRSNRGYTPYTYVKSIILGLISGADCIKDNRQHKKRYRKRYLELGQYPPFYENRQLPS